MAVPVRGLHAREETAARLLRAAAALAGPGDRLGQPRRQERCARRGPWVCRRSAAARPPLWSGARSGIRAAAAVSPPEGAGVKRPKPRLPDDVEEYRDARWCREGTRQIETAADAEQFIEQVGFTACLTDSRRPGPSLSVARRAGAPLWGGLGGGAAASPRRRRKGSGGGPVRGGKREKRGGGEKFIRE